MHLIEQTINSKRFKKGNIMKKLLLPISTLLMIVVGCDNPMRDNAVELDSAELQDFSSELAADLGLSKSSTEMVNGVLNRHGGGGKHRKPGFLWRVAGELSLKLSVEEKARLFEKMDEKEVLYFGGPKSKKGKSKKSAKSYFSHIKKVLTDDQKVTFKAIKIAYKEKFKGVYQQVKDGTLSKEDAKAQLDALKEAMKLEIENLLTEEQKAQIEQNKADGKAKRQAYRDSSKAVMIEVLGMSSDQVASFDAINTEAREAAKGLFEQVKNGDLDKESFRAALKNVFTEKNDKLEALFTDGQLEIIKIHKALELRKKKHRSNKGKKGGGKNRRGGRKGNNG